MKMDDDIEIYGYLPAVVIGHEASDLVTKLIGVEDPPPWLTWWAQQYGGLACLQASFAGLLLPLAAAPAKSERAHVLKVLDGFAHDSRGNVPWLPDELGALAWGCGKAYDEGQLRILDALFARGFALPSLQGGAEALAEFKPMDWSQAFQDWPVVTYEIPMQCQLTDPDVVHLIMGGRQVVSEHGVSEALLADVDAFFRNLGVSDSLRAYLVWFNSD